MNWVNHYTSIYQTHWVLMQKWWCIIMSLFKPELLSELLLRKILKPSVQSNLRILWYTVYISFTVIAKTVWCVGYITFGGSCGAAHVLLQRSFAWCCERPPGQEPRFWHYWPLQEQQDSRWCKGNVSVLLRLSLCLRPDYHVVNQSPRQRLHLTEPVESA